jgi:hypothetical protein
MNRFSKLIAGLVTIAAIAGATGAAQAGGYSHGGSVYHGGGYRHQVYPGGHRRDRVCEPYEAVEKARYLGLRHPGIERVTRWEIVVSGRAYGHRAVLVFDRSSRRCHVVASRGL